MNQNFYIYTDDFDSIIHARKQQINPNFTSNYNFHPFVSLLGD